MRTNRLRCLPRSIPPGLQSTDIRRGAVSSIRARVSGTLIGTLGVLSACASTQLAPIPAGDSRFVPPKDERRLWEDARDLERRIDGSGLVYVDSSLQAYLGDVLRQLITASPYSSAVKPTIKVIRDPFLNAFALPHGTIYIHTGMLARMDNEAQLAALLGHELTHVTHRHAIREIRGARNHSAVTGVLTGLGVVAGLAAGGQQMGSALGNLGGSLGSLWTLAAVSGYSRELETEADVQGLDWMIRAGYDPNEAPAIFEHLKREHEGADNPEPFFFGTHPRIQERLDNYRLLIASRYAREAAETGRTVRRPEYMSRLRLLLLDDAALDLRIGRINTAESSVAAHLSRWPETPRAHFLLAEIRRRSGQRDAAIDQYREAGRLDTAYADPHRELGLLARELGHTDEAGTEFERYLALSPRAHDAPIVRWYLKEMDRR